MPRFVQAITRPIYNPREWPEITGYFEITSDLVVGNNVVGRSHTKTVDEAEQWARNHARVYKVDTRWRVFTLSEIIACGIEYYKEEE